MNPGRRAVEALRSSMTLRAVHEPATLGFHASLTTPVAFHLLWDDNNDEVPVVPKACHVKGALTVNRTRTP